MGGVFNADIGTKRKIYTGEENENTNNRKSKGKVVNTEGKCLLKTINERVWHNATGYARRNEQEEYTYNGPRNTRDDQHSST